MNNEFSISELRNIAFENKNPLSVTLELLTECNWRCKHCYIPQHNNKGLEAEKIINLLHELREMGTLNLTLTGGEIFCREDIFKIIETARNLNFRVFLMTNASMLNEEKIRKLSELNITEFSVSVFSLDSSVHDSITGISGSLKRTLDNIELMKRYNVHVVVKTPLMQENYLSYKKIREYCEKNKFQYIVSAGIFCKNNGDVSPHSLRIKAENLEEIVEDLDSINNESTMPLSDKTYPCSAIFYSFFIDCKGDVYPCNSFYYKLGNVFDSSISDIWNSDKLEKLRKITKSDLHKCNECSLLDSCQRCPGLALLEDNDLCGCSSVAKYIATARHKVLERR